MSRPLHVNLSKEYHTKLELLTRLTKKSKTELIREAIDLLVCKYVEGKELEC